MGNKTVIWVKASGMEVIVTDDAPNAAAATQAGWKRKEDGKKASASGAITTDAAASGADTRRNVK